jgi:hypothetical protein
MIAYVLMHLYNIYFNIVHNKDMNEISGNNQQ